MSEATSVRTCSTSKLICRDKPDVAAKHLDSAMDDYFAKKKDKDAEEGEEGGDDEKAKEGEDDK